MNEVRRHSGDRGFVGYVQGFAGNHDDHTQWIEYDKSRDELTLNNEGEKITIEFSESSARRFLAELAASLT